MVLNEKYMQRCLQLAAIGGGDVSPNPMVGAVLVVDNNIIGEGYHKKYGQPHAEPNAIKSVQNEELLKLATLYVNLEPCSHYGNTPPCAELIVSCGIPRVVIGTLDPNPKVSGRGVEIMRKAGIEVIVGVFEDKCYELNKRFFTLQTLKRPYILLKWAQTLDGFMDTIRESSEQLPLQISNEITRQFTHKIRSENQAIMVSTNTVVLDNPSLTVRYWSGKNPIRIALDRQGRIPASSNLLDGQIPTFIFTEQEKKNSKNLSFIKVLFDDNCLQNILAKLCEIQIHSVLVEGGAKLLRSFIASGLWDEAQIEISELKIKNGIEAPIISLIPESSKIVAGHRLLKYINPKK
ncbi:MAG: bifunctional diaminohydroxyphosphoribosylaminopyrimidine deaminase/5-amino-6-(5-phosphoribosylamino)uracil reductase RibD [Paludibacter sp.]